MVINRFDRQHTGEYTCRPIPPQKVQSPPVSLALGCAYKWMKKKEKSMCVLHVLSPPVMFFSCCPADAPHFTSITVFPAGEVTEGGSVTLTCSSDAAPLAESFVWFKGMVAVFCRNRSSASINTHFHVHSAFYLRVM